MERTDFFVERTILWNDVTIDWNDLTMERNDRISPCGFRPFDFYSKLKIENHKFKSQIYNLSCQFLFLRNIKLKNNFQCFKKSKIENGQLVVFISCF